MQWEHERQGDLLGLGEVVFALKPEGRLRICQTQARKGILCGEHGGNRHGGGKINDPLCSWGLSCSKARRDWGRITGPRMPGWGICL